MLRTLIASALAASTVAVAVAPVAEAQTRHRVRVCHSSHHVKSAATTGTVVGAVGGGLLGHALGGKTAGTVVGAGAGAVAGHEIAKHNAKKCHWEYR